MKIARIISLAFLLTIGIMDSVRAQTSQASSQRKTNIIFMMSDGIRTERYKLIHFYDPGNSWELCDLKKGPHEMHNLYGDAAYGETVEKLKEQLRNLQHRYNDLPGRQTGLYDEKNK
jgi:arylsulfatase A-like enzyme